MTNETAITTVDTNSIVSEFAGGASGSISAMIGIGAVKESDAPFQMYRGEEQEPVPLLHNNGKPVLTLNNLRLQGVEIADGVGKFNATKLNLFVKTDTGTETLMLTCGLTTYVSQFIICGLLGMTEKYGVNYLFHLRTKRGEQGMRPWFASIVACGSWITDEKLRDQLKAAKGTPKMEQLLRSGVEALKMALGTYEIKPVDVIEATTEEAPF